MLRKILSFFTACFLCCQKPPLTHSFKLTKNNKAKILSIYFAAIGAASRQTKTINESLIFTKFLQMGSANANNIESIDKTCA